MSKDIRGLKKRKRRALHLIAETLETGATMLAGNVQPDVITDYLVIQDERIKRLVGSDYTAAGVQ